MSTAAASPLSIEDMVQTAMATLSREIALKTEAVASHQVTIVHGLEQAAVIDALATYALIIGIGQATRVNLSIATELLGSGPEFSEQLRRDVYEIIGDTNLIPDELRDGQRDPWFTECIGHCLLNLSRNLPKLGPPGTLSALTPVHVDVRDHGLDLVGLHLEKTLLGLSVAEAKASEKYASQHASSTAVLFTEIDRGERDLEIRQKVQLLREALTQQQQPLVTRSFWQARRAYLAIISYGDDTTFSPTHQRPAYKKLAVGTDRIRLLAIPLSDYRKFFNDLSNQVRALLTTISSARST